MKYNKRISLAVLSLILIIACKSVNAQDDALNPDTYFKELLSPQTLTCTNNCYGIFAFTAPTDGKPIDVTDIGFQFLDESKKLDNSKNIKVWNLESNTSSKCENICTENYDPLTSSTKIGCVSQCEPLFNGIDITPIQPGETRLFKITASINDNIEWIPGLIVNTGTVENPQLSTVLQTKWALWLKGELSNYPNLTHSYHLNDLTTPITDSTGGVNLIARGTPTYGGIGIFNRSILFGDGKTYFNGTIARTSSFTYSWWFKPTRIGVRGAFFSDGEGSNQGVYCEIYSDDTFRCELANGTGSTINNPTNITGAAGIWSQYALTYDSTTFNITTYINGSKQLSNVGSGALSYSAIPFNIGAYVYAGTQILPLNGSLDEFLIFNSVLNKGEILDLYNAALTDVNITYPLNNTVFSILDKIEVNVTAVVGFGDNTTRQINITNISGQTYILMDQNGYYGNVNENATPVNNTHWNVTGKYLIGNGNYTWSIKAKGGNAIISTATQDVSWSVNSLINSNINNSFVQQVPADISTINVFSTNSGVVNISYYISPNANSTSTVNISSIRLCYFENKSTGQVYYYLNGTQVQSTSTCQLFTQNDTTTNIYSWSLTDNNVYVPGAYLLSPQTFATTSHTANTLTNANNLVKATLWNVTNKTAYNILEFMANNTGSCINPMLVYYCNSTYTSGIPSISPYCANIYTQLCDTAYNHSHGANKYSSHILVPLGFLNGKLNGIPVTPTSQIMVTGAGASTWQWWSIPVQTNPTAIQTSSNGGTTWSNSLGSTWDIHIHQYTGNESLWYMTWVQNQTGSDFNSSSRQDLINLGGLPPTQPNVFSPLGNVSSIVKINWSESSSPNSYNITDYVIKLYNTSFNELSTIVEPNGTTFGYVWNSASVADNYYYIGVYACDSNSLCSTTGFSPEFRVDNTGPSITISSPTNTSYLTLVVTLTASAIDSNMPISTIWYTLDGGSNSIYTGSVDINTVSAGGHVINVSANDTLGNVGSSNVAFTTSPIPPYITAYVLGPLSIFYSQVTYGTVTLAVGDNPIDKVWLQTAGGVVLNITSGSVGVNNIPYFPNGNYGTFYVYAHANDTSGYSRTSTNYYTLVIQPPLNVSNSATTNNLLGGNPLKAAAQAFTNLLGGLFWAIIIGVLFVALWLRTNNFIYPTLMLFTLTTILGVELPPIAQQISYAIYFAAAGLILYRLWSPSYTQ